MTSASNWRVQEGQTVAASSPPVILASGCSKCIASSAQQRVWLDEGIYSNLLGSPSRYNVLLPLTIKHGTMSIERIRSSIVAILEQFAILRTALRFDENSQQLEQEVQPVIDDNNYSYQLTSNVQSPEEIIALLVTETTTHFAQIKHGLVLRCHLIKRDSDDVEHLHTGDLIVFIVHHIAFDLGSFGPFLDAFRQAYDRKEFDSDTLQYIDFTLWEYTQLIDLDQDSTMNRARRFWSMMMDGYDWNGIYPLSVTPEFNTKTRSNRDHLVAFTLDHNIVDAQMHFVSLNNITMFQLNLACYFIFLYKLGQGNTNTLCVLSPTHGRWLPEMKSMIGMFVNLLPYRVHIESTESFVHLVLKIHRLCIDVLEHAHLPYQQIISGIKSSSQRNIPLHFSYVSHRSSLTYGTKFEKKTEDATLGFYSEYNWTNTDATATQHFSLNMILDHQERKNHCIFQCSADLYSESTIAKMARQFQHLLMQLFSSSKTTSHINGGLEPIANLSLLLPEDTDEFQRTTFRRLSNIIKTAPASYAQARIWLDEHVRFDPNNPQVAIYNMPFLYRLSYDTTLSISQLRRAVHLIVIKHQSLRTSLLFDSKENMLMQRINDFTDDNSNKEIFTWIESTFQAEDELNSIMHDERGNPHHFNLARGLIFRCHILHRKQTLSDDFLDENDALVFNFHHALFDFPSMDVFHHDLNQAYTTGELISDDKTDLRYLDYAVIERQMSMATASMFWLNTLRHFEVDRSLPLPFDRHRVSDQHRTGRGQSISLDFGENLSQLFVAYASSMNITPEILSLACYYAFLFKLTNGTQDLCVGMNTHGRYKTELWSLLGMFVNAIPLPYQIDPQDSLHHLVEEVHGMVTKSLEYSYFPLQRILAQHPLASKPAFLDRFFEFNSIRHETYFDQRALGIGHIRSVTSSIKIGADEVVSKFDFSLNISHDLTVDRLSCTINASLDLFDAETINKTAQRFILLLRQLFEDGDDRVKQPLYNLSLLLSGERALIASMNKMEVWSRPIVCVHEQFSRRASEQPQKVAVELDDQSLTYSELLYYVEQLALRLLLNYSVSPGEIICQCVERCLEMVIGQIAIMACGAIYCPLSPDNPPGRLAALLSSTNAQLILAHPATMSKFPQTCDLNQIDIVHEVLLPSDVYDHSGRKSPVGGVSDHVIDLHDIAYLVFTSGSTGNPKAVQITHKNLMACITSFQHLGIFDGNDVVIQMAQCSFDVHVKECLGTLIVGGTLALLHPQGHLDHDYLSTTLELHNVTFFSVVPSFMSVLCDHLYQMKLFSRLKTVRSFGFLGEAVIPKTLATMEENLDRKRFFLYNLYGPAECTLTSVYHRVTSHDIEQGRIPIGRPFPNTQILIHDYFSQPVFVGREGELLIGGVGVFAGYLGRDDLTAKVLVNIDGHLFYRTGDLVRFDNNGLLHYLGRKDHQVKLRGQRIELGEIERCLLDASISTCVVIKWGDDHLIAYVQSSGISEEQLLQHCRSRLPPFMIPSMFIVLKQFPLNANGKLDRNRLPRPDLGNLGHFTTSGHNEPHTEVEQRVHDLWCQVVQSNHKKISTTTSFFSIGGHSLLLIKLYHLYQLSFGFDSSTLTIASFMPKATIRNHARLLSEIAMTSRNSTVWQPLHINEGPASFAQERIFLDEQIRFSKKVAIYNELTVLKVMAGSLSVKRVLRAIRLVLNKHQVLRTCLVSNDDDSTLRQCITHCHETFTFANGQTFENDDELNDIIQQITFSPTLFDLSNGRVFYCGVLRQELVDRNNDKKFITATDILIVAFHHAAFDRASRQIFVEDLCIAYNSDPALTVNTALFRYIDYSVHERLMDMTQSRKFWHSQLNDYDLERPLKLPMDRHHLSIDKRSGLASVAEFSFDDDLLASFLAYTSSHQITLFQLGLATFYAFLFKLCDGQSDLCIACINSNRYRVELQDLFGMFVAILPYRVQLDPRGSFEQLVEHVRGKCLSILEHSHYPLQHILADSHHQQSTPVFLETVFDFITLPPGVDQLILDDAHLEPVPLQRTGNAAKYDMMSTFVYNPSAANNLISCTLVCSRDLFDQTTIQKLTDRYASLVRQLFGSVAVSTTEQPLYKLSIILPPELGLIHQLNINYHDKQQRKNSTIGELFAHQAGSQPQKVAVELDEQSLTYNEFLYYVQRLALHLLHKHALTPGDIVCQCVQRSLSMVIGIVSIEMAGGVYCPLSPRDPEQRLNALVKQTQSRLVLVHWMTRDKFTDDIVTFDIDEAMNTDNIVNDYDLDLFSRTIVTPESIAFVIFTSGSTGLPKAVQITHQNLVACIVSFRHLAILDGNDVVIQMAQCSFDVHVKECLGTLMLGGLLVLLHPEGQMNLDYLSTTLQRHNVTFFSIVPSLMSVLCDYLIEKKAFRRLISVRSFGFLGEAIVAKTLAKMGTHLDLESVAVYNLYGPAECTLTSVYHRVTIDDIERGTIPIGLPFPNMQVQILDDFFQPVVPGAEGELFLGGVQRFPGYFARDDLTAQALFCSLYKTNDIVRLDSHGLLHYVGRKDQQVKLRGQRIELGEIERCLLDTSISACVVIKWDDDHLIAYVQSPDITVEQLREHCLSRLPPFMVPSMFMVLEELPLNPNGKLDRKRLPTPDFSTSVNGDHSDLCPLTLLEEHLRRIFARAFHNESVNENVSFGRMGGTSLDAMRALSLIRQQICSDVEAALLFANPSVRQLARAIEPLLVLQKQFSVTPETTQLEEDHHRPMPSLLIEALSIVLLAFQWLYPVWIVCRSEYRFALIFLPLVHLLSYIVWQRLLFRPGELILKDDKLYSWRYYRWWFLDRLWSINNSYWLQHLLGTPFYNSYLRLCGAQIGCHTHIYTTNIDAPWLLQIGESTFIGEEVRLSSLSYDDQTYNLHPICIRSYCSINTRSVLYDGVIMHNHAHVEPLSAITGQISASVDYTSIEDRTLSWCQILYQFICVLCLFFIHGMLLVFTYFVHCCCSSLTLPLSVSLALNWLVWTLTSLIVVLLLLKFVVGRVTPGHYSFNSYYYLHKLWLRQLIISSFNHSLEFLLPYDALAPVLLRWLDAHVEDDVKLAEFRQILRFPSNLLKVERGVTTFGRAMLASFEMTQEGHCRIDEICLSSDTNLGNWCILMPSTRLSPKIIVGSLTRVTRETDTCDIGTVLLGIPARKMPFIMSDYKSSANDLSFDSSPFHTLLLNCLSFFIGKCLFIALYSLLPVAPALLVHTVLFCAVYHYSNSQQQKRTRFSYSETITRTQQFLRSLMADFMVFVGPYLSGTQFLVLLFRALGARIGRDVILPDISCLTDPHLVTIGDHVRLNMGAYIQCHTFEQRLLKLAPVTVNHSSVLMSGTLVLSGSTLLGRNRILPCTCVMKDDELPRNTNWSGVPAQKIV